MRAGWYLVKVTPDNRVELVARFEDDESYEDFAAFLREPLSVTFPERP